MRVALVLGVLGKLLQVFALAFLPPLALAAWDAATAGAGWRDVGVFAASGATTWLAGRLFARWFRVRPDFGRAEALAVVAGAWLMVAQFAAVPYLLSGLDFFDAYFESMSGLTTTGATVLTDFGVHTRAFFLWRSMTQWFGGLGVIALFVVVLPQLGIAGRQIFFAEASAATTDVISPNVREAARRLWVLYVFLTVLEVFLLVLVAEFPLYEAVCHSLTTMSAGGFSPHPQSLAGYANPLAEWIIVVFMVLSGVSFPLLWVGMTRRPLEPFRDGEFRFYVGAMAFAGVALGAMLSGGMPEADTLRTGLFQSASLISSTGFASVDFATAPWTDGMRALLLLVMLLGGGAGSAAGGAKAVRNLLTLKFMYREFTRVLHPRGVIPLRHRGRAIPDDAMRAILNLVVLYLVVYVLLGCVLVVLGVDFVTGFTAALACVGNIGPGFEAVGPMGSFADFDPLSKILLTVGMWLGRLEMVTVLVLLHPDVWRRLRWKGVPTSPR